MLFLPPLPGLALLPPLFFSSEELNLNLNLQSKFLNMKTRIEADG